MHQHQINQQANSKKQTGATLIGLMLVLASLMFIAFIAMKVFPAYQEYYSVKMVILASNKEPLSTMSEKEIQDSFNRRSNVNYVTVVSGTDLTLNKNGAGETVASVKYQVIKPLFGNVSVLIDFATSSDNPKQ